MSAAKTYTIKLTDTLGVVYEVKYVGKVGMDIPREILNLEYINLPPYDYTFFLATKHIVNIEDISKT